MMKTSTHGKRQEGEDGWTTMDVIIAIAVLSLGAVSLLGAIVNIGRKSLVIKEMTASIITERNVFNAALLSSNK